MRLQGRVRVNGEVQRSPAFKVIPGVHTVEVDKQEVDAHTRTCTRTPTHAHTSAHFHTRTHLPALVIPSYTLTRQHVCANLRFICALVFADSYLSQLAGVPRTRLYLHHKVKGVLVTRGPDPEVLHSE